MPGTRPVRIECTLGSRGPSHRLGQHTLRMDARVLYNDRHGDGPSAGT